MRAREIISASLAAAAIAVLAPAAASAQDTPPPVPVPDDSGSVTGTVELEPPPSPCIMLDGTSVDFGTLPFLSNGIAPFPRNGSPTIGVTNCSGTRISLFGQVSGARADGRQAVWSPHGTSGNSASCPARGLNRFIYLVTTATFPAGSVLVGTDRFVTILEDGGSSSLGHRLGMPCEGSTVVDRATITSTFTASL